MLESALVREITLSADELVSALLTLAETETVCILDSCGVGYLDSHLLIAGLSPIKVLEIRDASGESVLRQFEDLLAGDYATIFTLSYGLGQKLAGIASKFHNDAEPDLFAAQFAALLIHDYRDGATRLVGDKRFFNEICRTIHDTAKSRIATDGQVAEVTSNFTRAAYLAAIATIKERIRDGDTYQTNLTRQLAARLDDPATAARIFAKIRRDHPAPFSALLKRPGSTVISASPERFFKVSRGNICTSPIKGTRPRGGSPHDDGRLKQDLLTSRKDIAENTMIVDLLRNDLGRVCEYGSVKVEQLCQLEEHPTYFHLVSTISGTLRQDVSVSDILRALFPCGSITGAPKISTMRIIDEIETAARGLSMGAIGYHIPGHGFGIDETLDLSVAIRTMVVRDHTATFNVGGGIVIDSEPGQEWEETLTKARALLDALNGRLPAESA